MRVFTFRFIAIVLILGATALEFYGLATGRPGLTWTNLLRELRFDPVAGPVFIVFWTWLTFHIFFNPKFLGGSTGWRDLAIYLPVGALLAIGAALLARGAR